MRLFVFSMHKNLLKKKCLMNKDIRKLYFPYRGICHSCNKKRFVLYDGYCSECFDFEFDVAWQKMEVFNA